MTTIRELLDGGWADMDTEILVRRSDEDDYAYEVIPERMRADVPSDDNLLVLSVGDGFVMVADEGDEDEDDGGDELPNFAGLRANDDEVIDTQDDAAVAFIMAVGRKETDPCERGTVGCSVKHTMSDGACQTW